MQSRQLYDLQEIDLGFSSAEEKLTEVLSKLTDETKIVSLKEGLLELTIHLAEIVAKQRASDGTVVDLQERIKNLETKLYSGSITNPKEAAAVEEERLFTVEQRKDEEENLLEIMVNLEELEAKQSVTESELKHLEETRPSEKVELKQSKERLEAEISLLKERRNEVVLLLQPRLLKKYDSLKKTRKGQAVSKVERGMCQGCRLTLPQSDLQRARNTTDIVQCSSCQRILFVG